MMMRYSVIGYLQKRINFQYIKVKKRNEKYAGRYLLYLDLPITVPYFNVLSWKCPFPEYLRLPMP